MKKLKNVLKLLGILFAVIIGGYFIFTLVNL